MNHVFVEHQILDRMLDLTTETSFVLKPSDIAGIGVFAIHGIKSGTPLRLFVEERTRFIPRDETRRDSILKTFCEMYGVEIEGQGDGYWTAPDFSQQSVGWYLNHSLSPNAHHDTKWQYFASGDIQAGQEITVDYGKI
jgi:SET domain-containing protein